MSAFSWFSVLEEELYKKLEFVDAAGLFKLRAFANALKETILDELAIGQATRQYKGHDHAPDTVSGEFGGRPVARGPMFTGGGLGQIWLVPYISSAATWTRADNTLNTARPSNMFYVPVSQGIISTGAPPTTPPYLEAILNVDFTAPAGSPSLDMRMTNLSWGGASAVTVVTAGAGSFSGQVVISGIHASQGWNRMNLELRSNLSGVGTGINVNILDMIILERPSTSVPASSGSAKLGGTS